MMLGNISYMFDYWANPVIHLLLLKSSMVLRYKPKVNAIVYNQQPIMDDHGAS